MGIEHPQMDAVNALFSGSPAGFAPTADLFSAGSKTPNQRALACAIALAWAPRDEPPPVGKDTAVAMTRNLFQAMAINGHQAVGPTFGCEEGAPDPHSALWLGAMATILREARQQGIAEILEAALDYFADHVAMGRAFWTPAGIRMPCGRAKVKGTQALRPNWTVDSVAYANICGLPTTGLGKPDPAPLKILQDSASLFPIILERSKTTALKLAVPIRRWPRAEGGFIAAMVKDVPMNDRCSWVIVDATGTILGAANTLDSFVVPEGEPVVIGDSALVSTDSPSTTPTTPVTPTTPTTPTIPVTPASPSTLDLPVLAAQVRSLLVPHKQATVKEDAAKAIEEGRIADALPLVSSFGIGPAQPQAVTWRAVIAALKGETQTAVA
jgi:stage V sporulation protein SpoVS